LIVARRRRSWESFGGEWSYRGFPPYVPAAERQRLAAQAVAKRRKDGLCVEPVTIEGRSIAGSFWGKSWLSHLEGYSDYANRLPRGRTYVRNGSVVHLAVSQGRVEALVQGTSLYEVKVTIVPLAPARWKEVVGACSGKIDSLVELLRGNVSDGVMRVVTDRKTGIFPSPKEIKMTCSCPDWAEMCKHLAAVLYGLGARFDKKPELLFALRGVDHLELLSLPAAGPTKKAVSRKRALADSELGSVFGIELESKVEPAPRRRASARRAREGG
jgi:uncharacterized Zn finger protein